MRKFEYKYKIDTEKNTVVALTTFAGKVVRGVARCNPEDTFNVDAGKKLAAARCSVRVAEKRTKRANECLAYAKSWLENAQRYYAKMQKYNDDSAEAYNVAVGELTKIESQL